MSAVGAVALALAASDKSHWGHPDHPGVTAGHGAYRTHLTSEVFLTGSDLGPTPDGPKSDPWGLTWGPSQTITVQCHMWHERQDIKRCESRVGRGHWMKNARL